MWKSHHIIVTKFTVGQTQTTTVNCSYQTVLVNSQEWLCLWFWQSWINTGFFGKSFPYVVFFTGFKPDILVIKHHLKQPVTDRGQCSWLEELIISTEALEKWGKLHQSKAPQTTVTTHLWNDKNVHNNTIPFLISLLACIFQVIAISDSFRQMYTWSKWIYFLFFYQYSIWLDMVYSYGKKNDNEILSRLWIYWVRVWVIDK